MELGRRCPAPYDETDLMAVRVGNWKHRGETDWQLVRPEGVSECSVHLQSADGPDGEDGPTLEAA